MSRRAAAVAPVRTPAPDASAPALQRSSVRMVETPAPEVEKPEPVALAPWHSGGAAGGEQNGNRPDFAALDVGGGAWLGDPDLARAAVTHLLLQELAPALGLDPKRIRVNTGRDAEARVNARGASGLQEGATIHLHPARYRPSTPQGRYLLAHEAVHAAQRRLGGMADVTAAEAEAAQLAEAFAAREPLRQPVVALPALAVAADTGAELPFDILAWQNHESEFARIRKLLGGLWISDGDVNKVLLILKTLEPPTALALLKQLKSNERVDLVDNMHSVHRKGFRAEVLLCYWSLWQEEIAKNFDEDLFEDMNLSEPPLSVQEAFYVDYVVRNLKQKAQNKLHKSRNGHAIEVIQQFAVDGSNRSRWQNEARQELQKARGEEDEQARIRKETEEVWFKDQAGADKETKPGQLRDLVDSIRRRLDAWIVSDSTVLGILNDLEPYARDMSKLRAIADGLVKHSYEKKDDKYQYHEDKDYFQKLIDEIPVKELYRQNSTLRRTFLQLLLARPGYKSIETVIKLTDEGFFTHVTSEDAYLAYQLVRSMPPRARKAIMEFEGGERWGKVTSNLSMSQREGDTTNFYQGGKNGEDRNSILAQLLPDEIWAQAGRLQGVVGQAIAAGHYDWVFDESRRRYVAAKGYANDDIVAVAEMYKLYNPEARNDKGERAPRLAPDDKLLKGNPFWNEGALGFINQKIFGGLRFVFSSDDVEVATRALGGTGLNLADFQDITGGSFLGARFEQQDKLGMEGAEAKRKKKGVNYANMKWDRKLGVLEFEAERLAIVAINYPMTDMTIRTGRVDLSNVTVRLSYPTDSTPDQINVIDLYIGEAEIDNLMLIAPDSMKSINQVYLDGFRVLAKPSGKDLSQVDRPRDGALNQGLAVDLYWTFSNIAGAAKSGEELGNNVLRPSGGMELEVSLRSLRLKGITTSSGSYVESVVVENLDIGGGGTVDAYLRALNISSMRLDARLKRERKALAQSGGDKERSSHQKAIDQLSRQIEHNQREFTRVRDDQAEVARIEERQKQLSAESPPKQLPDEERKQLRELKASLMGAVMDVGHVKISGIADSPVKDLDLGYLHGQGRSTTALLGMLSESDTLSRFIEGGRPIVKGEKTGAAFSLDIGHVELPDLKLKGSIPTPADAQKDLDKFVSRMDSLRPDHVSRMEELQDRLTNAKIYDEGMKYGPDLLRGQWRDDFLNARRDLLKFEEDNALRIRSLTLEGAALNFDAEGGVGVSADEVSAEGLLNVKTGFKADSIYARKFALDARVKGGILELKEWRKNLRSGTLGADYLQVKGFNDPDSGIGVEELTFQGSGKRPGLKAGLDLNEGNASLSLEAPEITAKGVSWSMTERALLLQRDRLLRKPAAARSDTERAQLDNIARLLDSMQSAKESLADAVKRLADPQLKATDKARYEQQKADAEQELAFWQKKAELRRLGIRDLSIGISGLGNLLAEDWNIDRAVEKGITVSGKGPGGQITSGISAEGGWMRLSAGRSEVRPGKGARITGGGQAGAEQIDTGPIRGSVTYAADHVSLDDFGIDFLEVRGLRYFSGNSGIWSEGDVPSRLSGIAITARLETPLRDDIKETGAEADRYASELAITGFKINEIDGHDLHYQNYKSGLKVSLSSGKLGGVHAGGVKVALPKTDNDALLIKGGSAGYSRADNLRVAATTGSGLALSSVLNTGALEASFAKDGKITADLEQLDLSAGTLTQKDLDLKFNAKADGLHLELLPGSKGYENSRQRFRLDNGEASIKGSIGKPVAADGKGPGPTRVDVALKQIDTGDVERDADGTVRAPDLSLYNIKLKSLHFENEKLSIDVPDGNEVELSGTKANVTAEANPKPEAERGKDESPFQRIVIRDFHIPLVSLQGMTIILKDADKGDLTITLPEGRLGLLQDVKLGGQDQSEGFVINPNDNWKMFGRLDIRDTSLRGVSADLGKVLINAMDAKVNNFSVGFFGDDNTTVAFDDATITSLTGHLQDPADVSYAEKAGTDPSAADSITAKLKRAGFKFGWTPRGLGKAVLRGFKYDKKEGSTKLQSAEISDLIYEDPDRGLTIEIGSATVPALADGSPGFEYKDGKVKVHQAKITDASLNIDDILNIGGKSGKSAPSEDDGLSFAPSLDLVDQVSGHVHVTLNIFARGTAAGVGIFAAGPYAIKVDIDHGKINFKEMLNKSTGKLAGAALDLDYVTGSVDWDAKPPRILPARLQIDIHVPFVDPWWWELDGKEASLASTNFVKLSTFFKHDIQTVPSTKPTKQAFLDDFFFGDLDAHLELPGRTNIALGNAGSIVLGGDDKTPGFAIDMQSVKSPAVKATIPTFLANVAKIDLRLDGKGTRLTTGAINIAGVRNAELQFDYRGVGPEYTDDDGNKTQNKLPVPKRLSGTLTECTLNDIELQTAAAPEKP